MTTKRVFSNDREEQQKEFLSTRIGKGASGQQPHAQKSSPVKIQSPLPEVMEQEAKTPSGNGNACARIAERAYELYHRRGGHHGQDLEDWFVAEQEILAEDSGGGG